MIARSGPPAMAREADPVDPQDSRGPSTADGAARPCPSSRFGPEIRALRKARGWSQEQLAGQADLNRSYMGEI